MGKGPQSAYFYVTARIAKFTPGEHSPPEMSCTSARAAEWPVPEDYFPSGKKLTNTRLGISGDRLTRPIWGRFSTDISRRAAKGCQPDSCLSTGR